MFSTFNNRRNEKKHKRLCELNEPALMKMPRIIKKEIEDEDGNILEKIIDQTKMKFKNYSKLLKPLAVIYGDFEAVNIKCDAKKQYLEIINKDPILKEEYRNFSYVKNKNESVELKLKTFFDSIDHSWTIKLYNQVPSSYCLFLKSNYPEIFESKQYYFRGNSKKEVLKKYIERIDKLNNYFSELLKIEEDIIMTKEDEEHF